MSLLTAASICELRIVAYAGPGKKAIPLELKPTGLGKFIMVIREYKVMLIQINKLTVVPARYNKLVKTPDLE